MTSETQELKQYLPCFFLCSSSFPLFLLKTLLPLPLVGQLQVAFCLSDRVNYLVGSVQELDSLVLSQLLPTEEAKMSA